jgi:seryl-tRNA synthetase
MAKEYCDQHSGCVQKDEALRKEVADIKLELREHKGYVLGKFDQYSHEVRELSEKVTKIETTITDRFKYIEDKFKDLENKINGKIEDVKDICDEIKKAIKEIELSGNAKEDKKENKTWVVIGQVISPLVVLALWTLVQHFLK